MEIVEQKFQTITEEEWRTVCNHAQKVKNKYLVKEPLMGEVQKLIIYVNTGKSDEDFSCEKENMGCCS